jgi:hypothetical protein
VQNPVVKGWDRQLVSLLDMLKYSVGDLAMMLAGLQTSAVMLKFAKDPQNPLPDPEYLDRLHTVLDGMHRLGSGLDFDTSLTEQIESLMKFLKEESDNQPATTSIKTRLDVILEGVLDNLKRRMFMYVPAGDAIYWNNLRQFGNEFVTAFPTEAVMELGEMGNCFVASRATACVFHCMRIAEYGLRKLAKLVNVKLTDKGKLVPVEYATWDKVIQSIRSKITTTRQLSHGPKKARDLQFYSDAADHCEYMKDIWRNEISHTRPRSYNREETLSIINRVRDFVQLLAKHELPKNPKKLLDRINKRLREFQPIVGK